MKHSILFGLAALTLAACSGNPISVFGPDDGSVGPGGDEPFIPDLVDTCEGSNFVCGGDVVAISINTDTDVLSITGTPFDETELAGTYVRADLVDNVTVVGPGFDFSVDNLNGFAAYENDDGFAIAPYVALNQDSPDGSITVGQVAVADGYVDFGYGGFWIRVNEDGTVPTEQLAQYEGAYAGIIAFEGDTSTAGPVLFSQGDVLLNVDFTDGVIQGDIVNRELVDSDGVVGDALPGLVFNDTFFTTANTYSGTSNSVGLDNNWEGTFQGVFTGETGGTTAGVFIVTQDDFFNVADDPDPADNPVTARETGTFIAERVSPPE